MNSVKNKRNSPLLKIEFIFATKNIFFYYLLIFKASICSKLTSLLVAFWRCRIKKGMLDHEACRQLYFVMEHRESLWGTQKLLIVLQLVPWALTKAHKWWKVFEQMVSMSSVAVASDRLIVTFMGTPPNCATGYRGDTVSQIMLLMEKMIMIIVVVRPLFIQNF